MDAEVFIKKQSYMPMQGTGPPHHAEHGRRKWKTGEMRKWAGRETGSSSGERFAPCIYWALPDQ